MTYNLINPTNHTQGNSQPLSLATASAPAPAPTVTTTLPVGPPNTAPTTVHHPSSGAKEISHPPDPLASGLEDPAIVKISAHFTKPATKPSKLPSKSPYNYEPQTVTNSSNQKSTATAVRSTITYGCKEDDILSLCCSSDLDSTHDNYVIQPADKLPPPEIQEDLNIELAEKKKATYFTDYPIINKIPSKSYGLKVHQGRTSPLGRVSDLDPKFESIYQKVQNEVTKLEDDKKPSIIAFVSPLEEHLLHYLPLKVKKTVVPEGYRPLQYKNRYINDTNLISLSEAVYGRLKKGLKTILLLGGWSNFINDYETDDQQIMLTHYISLVFTVCLRRLKPCQTEHLELIILGPVPQGTSDNLVQAPNYSLSLARRLTMTETYAVPWTYFNSCGLMGEIFNFNRRHPSHTFTLFDPVLKVITKNFARILEISLSKLICAHFLGNRPDDSWKANFRNNPRQLPNHLEIFDSSLDQQGLIIQEHGLFPATVPFTHIGTGYPTLSPHTQLGEYDSPEDNHSGLHDLNRLDSMEVGEEEEDNHQQSLLPDLRTSITMRSVSRSPSQTSSRTLSPTYVPPQNPCDETIPPFSREDSLHSCSDASETRAHHSRYGPLRARQQSHAASLSEDSDTSRKHQRKFPRFHRNRDTLSQMCTTSNHIPPPVPRPGAVSPHSHRRPRERGRERQRDNNHTPNHRQNLRFNDYHQPFSHHWGKQYGNFRPQPLLEANFPAWDAPREERGRSPNGILGIPSQEPYRPAIRPRSKSQVDYSRNRPDLRPYARPRQWRPYRGGGHPQNFKTS